MLTFAELNHLDRQVFFNANGQHKSMLVILSNFMYFSLRQYDFAKIPLHLANTIPKLTLSGDFPSVLRGENPTEENTGVKAGDEELTITLFLRNCYKTWCFAPVEWLALVKHSTGIMRAVMRPAAAVFTVQGSSQQCRSSGKALSLYIPHTHLTHKIFPLSQSMSIL